MAPHDNVQRDTSGWRMQAWLSFAAVANAG